MSNDRHHNSRHDDDIRSTGTGTGHPVTLLHPPFDGEAIEALARKRQALLDARNDGERALRTLRDLAADENEYLATDARLAVDSIVDPTIEQLCATANCQPVGDEPTSTRLLRPFSVLELDGHGWRAVAMVMSSVAAATAAAGLLAVTATLMIVRIIGAIAVGGALSGGLTPLDAMGGQRHLATTRRPYETVRACTASHLFDSLILAALAVHLLRAGDGGWATVPLLATTCMLAGTVARVAVAQIGVLTARSIWERINRVVGSAAVLVVASRLSHIGSVPVAALAGVPAAAYGLFEVTRTFAISHDPGFAYLRVRVGGESRSLAACDAGAAHRHRTPTGPRHQPCAS